MPSAKPTTRATRRAATAAGWLCGAVLLVVIALWPFRCRAEAPPALDFLYIDSAMGEAAGGHTAVRLGERVFHYQFYADGLFLMVNDPWTGFRYQYNDLQNRSLTLTRVPLSREAYTRIRSRFFSSFVLQEHRLRLLDQLTGEQDLLRRCAAGEDEVSLEALGLFSAAGTGDPHALELKNLVERRFGATWLGERLIAADLELGRISFRGQVPADHPDEGSSPPGQPAGWGVRLRELLSFREALRLLGDARGLADDALITADGNGGPLTEEERAAGLEFLRRLADSVLALLDADRPDKGTALLLQAARYQALSRTLATGKLATLDPFSDQAERRATLNTAGRNPDDDPLIREAREELALFRQAFTGDAIFRDTSYSRIEEAQGRLSELERARRLGAPERIEEGYLVPRRSRPVRAGLHGTAEDFAAAARVATANRERYEKKVHETYGYNLFTRNCVTEIVREVNDSFETHEQKRESLGGAIEPGERLSFIPFRLPAAIQTAFPSTETEALSSYRLRRLDQLYKGQGPLVWFRENNTLTSTLYSPSWTDDSVFLFFTDDLVAARPLLGALNLLYATVHAAGGLLLAPVDQGKLLAQSLRGMLYSLPEIAFFNIRKGTYRSLPEILEARP